MYKSIKKTCSFVTYFEQGNGNKIGFHCDHLVTQLTLSPHNPNTDQTFRSVAPKDCVPVYHCAHRAVITLTCAAAVTPAPIEPEELEDSRE